MRIGDLDEIAITKSEAYLSAQAKGKMSLATQALNSVVHQKIQMLISDTPTIDPETLPIVQELKKAVKKSCKTVKQQKKELDRRNKVIHELERQLDKVTAERDTMLKEFAGECGVCANYDKCKKYPTWCINGNRWKYRGLQEE